MIEEHVAWTGVAGRRGCRGGDADLWIGTLDRGLLHWKAGALDPFDGTVPDPRIFSLALDGDTIYAGTGVGVVEIRGAKV